MNNPDHTHLDDEQLSLYLDGELSTPARAEVEHRLAGCPVCQGRLEQLQVLFAHLEAIPDEPLAQDLHPLVMSRLASPPGIARQGSWLLALQLVGGVLAAALSWSYVSRQVGWLPGGQFIPATLEAGSRVLAQALLLWDTTGARLLDTLQSSLVLLGSAPIPRLQPASAWPWLGAATILWLLGNGVLLRPRNSTHRSTGPQHKT